MINYGWAYKCTSKTTDENKYSFVWSNVALPIKSQLAVQHFYMLCQQWNVPAMFLWWLPVVCKLASIRVVTMLDSWMFNWNYICHALSLSLYVILHLVSAHCVSLFNKVKLCGLVVTIYAIACSLLLANLYFWYLRLMPWCAYYQLRPAWCSHIVP